MTFNNFIKELSGNRVEGELLKTIFFSLLTSVIFLVLVYLLRLKTIDNVIPKYGLYIFLSALSIAIITPSIQQIRSYNEFPCMSGMMIGMTIGMISSFLPSFYVGANNGMFVGAVFGMLVGMTLGLINGRCCGIMGIMEGLMAGFMGGLMGAMTAVMLLNDNLKAMAIIVFVISTIIMFSLNYMIYNETKNDKEQRKNDQFFNIVLTFILMALTTWLIVFGPRSFLFTN